MPQLSGAAIEEIWAAASDSFDREELRRILRFKTNRRLDDIVFGEQSLENLVFDLLEKLEKLNELNLFLLGLYEAREPPHPARDVIERVCPEALKEATKLAAEGQRAAAGIEIIKTKLELPEVSELIDQHREKLVVLMSEIDVLANYKRLHDVLQTIQFRHYPQIVDEMRRLRTDPVAALNIEGHILDLNKLVIDAQKASQALPDVAAVRTEQVEWVDSIATAVQTLDTAAKALDDMGAAGALRTVKLTMRQRLTRLNLLLTLAAKRLQLEDLVEVVAQVIQKIKGPQAIGGEANDVQQADLSGGLQSLQAMLPVLRSRVEEHDAWQFVEDQFLDTEEFIETGSPDAVDEFRLMWNGTKTKMADLIAKDPDREWASKSQRLHETIDAALAIPDAVQTLAARTNFRIYRHILLFHFFQVDRTLRAQCEAILAIRAPLKSLLE